MNRYGAERGSVLRSATHCGPIALLVIALFSACVAEVRDELNADAEIEGVAEGLTRPTRQHAVWLDDPARPLNEPYPPDAGYRKNVLGVSRSGEGQYIVAFDGPADLNAMPVISVAAYGNDNARCKVEDVDVVVHLLGESVVARVACHAPNGNHMNSRFVLHAIDPRGVLGRAAGGFVSRHGAVSDSFNPQGTVTASRTSAGNYNVLLGNLGSGQRGGTVQVTAFGTGANHCKIVSWGNAAGAPSTLALTVRCFATNSDTATDTAFFFLYDEQIPTEHNRGAYAWASQETTASYPPPTFYTFMTGPTGSTSTSATASLTAGDTGHYKMVYHGLNENVSWNAYLYVGAYGSGSEYCKIRNWTRAGTCQTNCDIEAHTLCFDKAGNRKNTRYVQTWGSFSTFVVQ